MPSWAQVSEPPLDDIFASTNLLRIAVDIPEEGMNALRAFRWDRSTPDAEKPVVRARVTEGGQVFTNVAVHLKGSFGSFRPIDFFPALTLNFDKFAPGQKFHDLSKISLNNSVQDPTCLHEKLSRELFLAAGVPVTRADHAVVTLNGRKLGLYVLVEGYGKRFLKRHFKKADGNLYEGGYLQDISQPETARLDSGENPDGLATLQKLAAATRQADPASRFREMERVLDVDRFLSMLAMEIILCHWDGYSMNRNNYRVYFDPETRKLVFMPHGMDQILGLDRPNLDLALLPPLVGQVSRALVTTPEGRRRHLERIATLATNLFKPDVLCDRVRQIDRKIAPELKRADSRWPQRSQNFLGIAMAQGSHSTDANHLCDRISTRAANLRKQLDHVSEWSEMPPTLLFDRKAPVSIGGWKPKSSQPGTSILCNRTNYLADCLHIALLERTTNASWRARAILPPGTYRLSGRARVTSPSPGGLMMASLRISGRRSSTETRSREWSELQFNFTVSGTPTEVEFVCEARYGPGDAWFDAKSITLSLLSRAGTRED